MTGDGALTSIRMKQAPTCMVFVLFPPHAPHTRRLSCLAAASCGTHCVQSPYHVALHSPQGAGGIGLLDPYVCVCAHEVFHVVAAGK
jgi:hypothetical protein